ncbi:Transposase [Paraburkholderia hospita]|nr:Transposase [Paraburkholderia hospita]
MKNDAQDAEAICEAASRPQMRCVPIKSPAQRSVLVLHRMRTGFAEERTALVNRLRGLLAEFGVFLPQGIHSLLSTSSNVSRTVATNLQVLRARR